ncbi:DUF58 domain-containing protein [Aureliella helgolandensis]|uniref:DUF58 domain-containing protein n=1 Tax=Aureliella helgolandensis TaxID=2527968 RepID=A0A518GGI7_9BACT|nr:DUF58 domain-containing protein [Aureliella helgolandensis]QDV27715.1 hypothetical protein Q31a_61080 [Aureliella helgolandensis]
MTNRCRILILVGVLGGLAGVLRSQDTLAILSLSILVWLFFSWCWFRIQTQWQWTHIRCTRYIHGRPAQQCVLWADRRIEVELRVELPRIRFGAPVVVRDWVPESVTQLSGESFASVDWLASSQCLIYQVLINSAGSVIFPGTQFQFQDPQGLFIAERFHDEELHLRSLPSFATTVDSHPNVKRLNSIPQHGIHRLQRAGLGSELLELREYQSGDPPKSIAWKVSARRDRLMTRQYESEVPVRLTLLVDGYASNRMGGWGLRMLDQLNYVAASVGRSAISAGDLVGYALMDQGGVKRRRPSGGERAFFQLLEALAEFTADAELPPPAYTRSLLHSALAVCQRRYPELMESKVNRLPWTFWPLPPWRKNWRHRQQIAALLGVVQQLSSTQTAQLAFDDHSMAVAIQRLLRESGWDDNGSTLPESSPRTPDRIPMFAREVLKSVSLARDNEVFVLMLDLLDADSDLDPLLAAVRVAVARHHRVVCICPTPTTHAFQSTDGDSSSQLTPLERELQVLSHAAELRVLRQIQPLKRMLRKSGARVAFAGDRQAIALVLSEAELVGSGRTLARSTR